MIALAALALAPMLLAKSSEPVRRLNQATAVFSESTTALDSGIPHDLFQKTHCVVIAPALNTAAFRFGGKYGKGYLLCRNKSGTGRSAPGTVGIEGGSLGFGIGGGADMQLSARFTLGAEGSVAAGHVGRMATAQTDAQMKADILSWSRSPGLLEGHALQRATLRQDLDDNAILYGRKLENRQIVTIAVHAPKAAAKLIAILNKNSMRERTNPATISKR